MPPLRRGVDLVVDALCASVMLAIVLMTLFQVANRFVLQYPIGWTDEGARFLAVWVGLLGAARCVREGSHIEIDLFFKMFGPRLQRFVLLFVNLLFILLVAIVIWQSTKVLPIVARQTAAASRISMAWIYAAAPVSAVLMFYYLVENVVELLRRRPLVAESHAPEDSDIV